MDRVVLSVKVISVFFKEFSFVFTVEDRLRVA